MGNDISKYSISALYYDHQGQIVQTHTSNHLGGFEDEYYAYTFTGKVKQKQHVHCATDTTTQTEVYTYTYDHAERLTKVTHKANASAAITLAQYTYDEVGRMKTKQLHATAETLSYDYNVRSWLTQVSGTKFNQTLTYNSPVNGITPTKEIYNGNISAMKWKAGTETTERGYRFTYDGVNRLTDALYGEGAAITANANRFTENLTYDKMGNITTLQRHGKLNTGYGLMDNLTYDYSGNQLTKVTDAATPAITYPGAFHFVDGANTTNEYTYDANGNLTKDLNKNITQITYNVLNLPKVITFGNANTITYTYDSAGNKLSVAYKAGSSFGKIDYVGNKVYKDGTLSMMHTEEGYITFSGATPIYHYYLKDHQGNNRVVMNQNGGIEQVNHYYPFGGLFGEGLQTVKQPYKYNGKELDRFEGLDMFDYGARMYDAARGGWGTVDPLAEKYYSISPYVYVANNPVNYVDHRGDSISLATIQQFDKDNNTNYTKSIINDLNNQTGLTFSTNTNGMLVYNKDKDGNPVISTSTDSKDILEQGSVTARSFLMNTTDHKDIVNVAFGIRSGVPPGSNIIGVNPRQINKLIAGSSGVDSRTLGWGMTLMHELHHTQVGGGLSDSPYSSGNPGPVVTQMNIIRAELNAKGANYGQRIDYPSTSIGFGSVLPFSSAASRSLKSTRIIPIGLPYILIK